ncbi:anthranilate synthase component II [Fimbriimonas ginsengisoli]|uniref:Glutamine amidotransferase of anthranilate synthase n=1 Tax=Fimbriimonas ginsengisoli Gsoil 348 TaxID=661478 RepID=A0A068NSN2_FIMGI|nr:aminodeoxychorismate/anthranilate synthase component II [Fimbriimonas ginsengisoli]AIE84604.1 glutamine amidotransferase of anthranilate synthase [Fimbriimonas ginsengisoli Gsoil 348]
MILVVDNYDSFTYNLVQYLGQCGAEIVVWRNDEISLEQIEKLNPDGIMLSPGPCTPKESGVCLDILNAALVTKRLPMPIFGVCLGHQAIGHVAGGVVKQAKNIMHGKASMVRHDGKGLFEGMPNPFRAIRYHSLVVTRDSVPPGFIVTATAEDDGEIMGLRHESLPIEGVQFHPESVLTEEGFRIVENFVKQVQPL